MPTFPEPNPPIHRGQPYWTPLHVKLQQTLTRRSLLLQKQRLLIAVSGGQDSLCLLRLLLDLQSQWQWHLQVVHCDHRWRPDSEANASHVAMLCQAWQVPCTVMVTEHSLPSEAAARTWRYQVFTDLANALNCPVVLTGHTASDRAETLLHNLMRGSGLDGLTALTWSRDLQPGLQLIRPLLNITRGETGQFCQEQALPIWDDSTNQELTYSRNRIRLELLPYLQQHLNAQVDRHLAQTAELLAADLAYLEAQTDRYWSQVTSPPLATPQLATPQIEPEPAADPASATRLNRHVLADLPLALQRRLIRRFLQQYLPQQPNYNQIEKVVALITAPNRSQTDPFPGGAIARVNGAWLELLELSQPG
ncbi:MAG: tRNA lysidine(34) synthetase TilS [Cyanobacteria bacterium P01_H01_bin.121]